MEVGNKRKRVETESPRFSIPGIPEEKIYKLLRIANNYFSFYLMDKNFENFKENFILLCCTEDISDQSIEELSKYYFYLISPENQFNKLKYMIDWFRSVRRALNRIKEKYKEEYITVLKIAVNREINKHQNNSNEDRVDKHTLFRIFTMARMIIIELDLAGTSNEEIQDFIYKVLFPLRILYLNSFYNF